jgi:excisionase family DNA binding protein
VTAGVFIPVAHCRFLVDAAVVDLAARQRNDGGAAPDAGYIATLQRMQAAAAAHGTPHGRLGEEGRWLTTAEAAPVMGVSSRRVRQLAAGKRIIARKPGRDWQVDARAAEDWRDRRRATDGNR